MGGSDDERRGRSKSPKNKHEHKKHHSKSPKRKSSKSPKRKSSSKSPKRGCSHEELQKELCKLKSKMAELETKLSHCKCTPHKGQHDSHGHHAGHQH